MMLGGARNSRNVRPPPLPEAVATYANVMGNGEPIIADARAPRRGRRRERAINEEDGDVQVRASCYRAVTVMRGF
jgi:hypothetical protein